MRRPAPLLVALVLGAFAFAAAPAARAADEPRIRSVSPAYGLRGSTVDVAIEGQNLHPYEELKCERGDVSMTVLTGQTPTRVRVRFVIPEGAEAGPVKVRLKTKTGIVTTEKFTVRLRSPVVTRVVPDTVTRGGTHRLVLTGSWLMFLGRDTAVGVEAPMTAKLVGKPTEKSLTVDVTVPPGFPPGPKALTVETTDGKFAAAFVVTLAPPVVTAVTPPEVARGTSVDVTIAGKFLAGVAPVALAVPDGQVEIVTRGPSTPESVPLRVTLKPTAATGPRTLVVQTPDGVVTARLTVTSPAPRVTRVNPAGVPRGATSTVDMTLENAPGDAAVRVVPEDPRVVVTREKDGRLRVAVAPDAAPGPRTLLVTHPFGLATAILMVNLKGPTVTGLSPGQIAPGALAEVSIEGQDLSGAVARLVADDPGLTVAPGPKPGTFKVAVAKDARPGPRPFLVRTSEGAAIGVLAVEGPAAFPPSVTHVSTTLVPRGVATEVRLDGVNLREAGDKPPQVSVFADGPAIPVEIVESTPSSLRLRLAPPADAAPGGVAVLVRTSEGVAAGALTIVPAVPAIESLAPSVLPRIGAGRIVAVGRHLAGATVTLARADGSGAVPASISDAKAERLEATVTLEPSTPAGPYLFVAKTPEGGAAGIVTVEPSGPVVDSVEPAMVGVPANAVLTVRGRHLAAPGGGTPTVTVTRVGGASNIRPQVVSATPDVLEVRILTLPGTPPAPHVLVVSTADGVDAGVFLVVGVPQPTVRAIEPAESARGEGVVVSIQGTGLENLAEVTFAGTGVRGAVLPGGTDREVKVRVTVAADAAPGLRQVTVRTPGGFATLERAGFTVR